MGTSTRPVSTATSDAGTKAPALGIMEAANRILQASPYFAIRSLQCRACRGVLTITGQVPSYYLKQMAQTVLQGVDGVERIENLVEVVGPSRP